MASARVSPRDIFSNRPLMIVASGHLTVDMYSGMIPVLFPALMREYDVSLGEVGLVALAYSGAASVSQPIFGWLADRFGTRYIGFTQIWCGVLFSTIGFAPSFAILVLLAGLAGLGSGMFHPMGAMNASAVTRAGQENMSMSVYVSAGTIGFAVGPLAGAAITALFGLHGTLVMLVPGVLIGGWLLTAMRDVAVGGRPRATSAQRAVGAALPLGLIAIVVGVMMLRQIPVTGIESFIPAWYEDLGYQASFYSTLATVMVLASAAGALGVGGFADRYGRRTVMLVTMTLTIPVVWAFITFPGPWAFLFGPMIGFLASSTGPLLLVMAQQLMVGKAGMASGLILGLGFVSGAIATPILGAIADATSMTTALTWLLVVVAASVAVAWFLPSERTVRAISDEAIARRDVGAARTTIDTAERA